MTQRRPVSESQLRRLVDLCGGVALLLLVALAIDSGLVERIARDAAYLRGQPLAAATAYGNANFGLPNFDGYLDQLNCYAGVIGSGGAAYNYNTGLPACALPYSSKSGGPVAEFSVYKTNGTLGRTSVLSFPATITDHGANTMGVPVGTSLTLEWSCQPTKHYVYTYCVQSYCAPGWLGGGCWCVNSAEVQAYNYFYQNGSNAAGQYPVGSTAGALKGSRTVTFTGDTTYTLSCSGFAGTGQISIPVVVSAEQGPTPGTITITGDGSNPASVRVGQSITIAAAFTPGTATQSQTFSSTGSDQTFTAPAGVTGVAAKLWGAAGGGYGSFGGGGGYTEGLVSVTPGTSYKIIVGKGGRSNSADTTYGGGGQATAAYNASGGGRSAFCGSNGGSSGLCEHPGLELLTAGGGGGGHSQSYVNYGSGGAGGGSAGEDGSANLSAYRGTGGTQTAGGFYAPNSSMGRGSQWYGGILSGFGGGGGGWYGGGAGRGSGGGSGHCGAGTLNCMTIAGSGSAPGRSSDADRPSGAAVGTGGVGGDGFVKLSYGGPETLVKTAINLEGALWCGTGCTSDPSMWTSPLSSKSYTFTPSAVGTYTFVPSMQTSGFQSWNDYGASLTVTVWSMDFSLSVADLASAPAPAHTAAAALADAGLLVRKRITATLVAGTPEAVTFSVSGLPPGASPTFSQTSCTPSCTSDLTILVPNSVVSPGTYMITVTGVGGGTTKTVTFPLVVGGAACTGAHEVPPLCSSCYAPYLFEGGVCVPPPPSVTFTVAPGFVRKGGSATASWNVSGLLPESTCAISSIPAGKVSALLPESHGQSWIGSAPITNVTGTVTVRISCNGGIERSGSVRLLPEFREN